MRVRPTHDCSSTLPVDHRAPAAKPLVLNILRVSPFDILRAQSGICGQQLVRNQYKDSKRLATEISIATHDNAFEMGIIEMGQLTAFTCPECNGALSRLKEGRIIRFRCHTGHAFTINSLLSEVSETVEDLLWQGMRGLEESNMLLIQMAKHFKEQGRADIAKRFLKKAETIKARAQIVHDSVLAQQLVSGDLRFESEGSTRSMPRERIDKAQRSRSKKKHSAIR